LTTLRDSRFAVPSSSKDFDGVVAVSRERHALNDYK
jgi:hypothetical protein